MGAHPKVDSKNARALATEMQMTQITRMPYTISHLGSLCSAKGLRAKGINKSLVHPSTVTHWHTPQEPLAAVSAADVSAETVHSCCLCKGVQLWWRY